MLDEKDPINILIAGMGGQGNIIASEIIARAAFKDGFIPTIGETYGASQRGGSVFSHIRLSKKFQYGPLIPQGCAHIILGLEPIDTLRSIPLFGSHNTVAIVNSSIYYPLSVVKGDYPYLKVEDVICAIRELIALTIEIDARAISEKAGSLFTQNTVMVARLAISGLIPVSIKNYEEAITEIFEGKSLEINLRVFELSIKRNLFDIQ